MRFNSPILKCLCIFIFLATPLHSSDIFLDVDEYEFKCSSSKGIRLSCFNPETQSYRGIEYWCFPLEAPNNFMDIGLKIEGNCNIEILPEFKKEKFVLRTSGTFCLPREWQKNIDYSEYISVGFKKGTKTVTYRYLYKGIVFQDPTALQLRLNQFTNAVCKPPFEVVYNGDDKRPFSSIVLSTSTEKEKKTTRKKKDSSRTDTTIERGKIGEVATILTMASVGWFHQLPTQNGSNQGLDGAFFSPDKQFLLLTESKCRKEKKSAPKYLEKEMNEKTILKKIKREGVPPETQDSLLNLLRNTPEKAFKAVHRLKPNGGSQWVMEVIKSSVWARLTLSPSSPLHHVTGLLKGIVDRAGLSQKTALGLFLKAVDLSPEEAIKILKEEQILAKQPPSAYEKASNSTSSEKV